MPKDSNNDKIVYGLEKDLAHSKEEIYYLKRDLERGNISNRDLSYVNYHLRKQRNILALAVVILMTILILVWLFK